jgi:hypothetical protein
MLLQSQQTSQPGSLPHSETGDLRWGNHWDEGGKLCITVHHFRVRFRFRHLNRPNPIDNQTEFALQRRPNRFRDHRKLPPNTLSLELSILQETGRLLRMSLCRVQPPPGRLRQFIKGEVEDKRDGVDC